MLISKKENIILKLIESSVDSGKETEITNEDLIKQSGINDRAVFRALKNLEKKKIISRITKSTGHFGKKRIIKLNDLNNRIIVNKKGQAISRKRTWTTTLWEDRYNKAKLLLRNGDYTIENIGPGLYNWINLNLHYFRKGNLDKDKTHKIKELTEIIKIHKLDFNPEQRNIDNIWIDKFKKVERFLKVGKFKKQDLGAKLYDWFSKQKGFYLKDSLDQDRREKMKLLLDLYVSCKYRIEK